MKKLTLTGITAIIAILAIGSLIVYMSKPHAGPSESRGMGWGSLSMAKGLDTEAFVQALQQNDFEMIEGKTFNQILPDNTQDRVYEGLVALRDTTVKTPNEFVLGVGPDTVIWFKSHDISGDDAIADWEAHIRKRMALVEQLGPNPQ